MSETSLGDTNPSESSSETMEAQAETASFTFAHLSDIHLAGYEDGATFDVDSHIRSELELDLESLVARVRPLDAIVIGGDIAGRGKKEEYEAASRWIRGLCEQFDVAFEERVFCVPGNHDVDRDEITTDPIIGAVQESLLQCRVDELPMRLERLLSAGPNRALALKGLEEYNLFAAQFNCAFSLTGHSWTQTLALGRLRLRIVGLASAILSGPSDAKEAGSSRLALGPQAQFHRAKDTFTVMVCHHPPGWLRDAEAVERYLEQAHLQLYGHQHSFDTSEAGAGVRIDAGAVHPSRKEDPWMPSYNLVSIQMTEPGSSTVTVDVYPRRYRGSTFGPSDETEPLRRHEVSVALVTPDPVVPSVLEQEPPPVTTRNERQLAYRFADLSVERRLTLGRELGLLTEDDRTLPEGAQIRKIFDNARARGELDRLEEVMGDG